MIHIQSFIKIGVGVPTTSRSALRNVKVPDIGSTVDKYV
jgi:hypothetical protein